MKTIHQLSPEIISQIAAGEVIERPAYVVKELVENALDAAADYITVQIENAGLKKIIVTDNGIGMSREDLEESVKPHTTSKLTHNTLLGISSFGFRGEALASIAAVSNLTIKSRSQNAPGGTVLQIENGKVIDVSPVGTPVGTSVTVASLFATVPARKKFLKSPGTEFRHIIEMVTNFAIVYPQVRFFVSHNGKSVLDLPRQQATEERLLSILGQKIFNELLPVKLTDSYISVTGFTSRPQLTTTSQNKNYIFINNRKVSDRLISLAVKEVYGSMLEPTAYPVFILFISLPYEMVDINVHPRKEQVSFINATDVFSAVKQAIAETLQIHNVSFHNLSWKQNKLTMRTSETNTAAAKLLKETVIPWDMRENKVANISADIVQLHNLFLVTQTDTEIVFIDQHAAHERILYEQFLQEFLSQRKKQTVFRLPSVVSVELPFSDAAILEENQNVFQDLGFTIENFGERTYQVRSIPLLFKDRNVQELITELLEDITDGKPKEKVDKKSKRMIAYLACRTAIKAGESLPKQEMKELVEKLERTPNHATCPHGRPTKIMMSLKELQRQFKRR